MEEPPRSPASRLAWFQARVAAPAGGGALAVHMKGVVHSISLTVQGAHRVRWITRRRETSWHEHAGAVHFKPADGDDHAFITAMSPDFESAVLFIPEADLVGCLRAEGCDGEIEWRRILATDDPVLRATTARLAHGGTETDGDSSSRDEASRRLVLRLAELSGGTVPCWQADASLFDRRTLAHLVDHVDAHLRIAPTLAEMGRIAGLSPSHFAKKFRLTTGLSLQRFVNRRRLHESLSALRDPSRTLARIALDLGFSSQSHFTRLFSGLVGMTPARYRKSFRRVVG